MIISKRLKWFFSITLILVCMMFSGVSILADEVVDYNDADYSSMYDVEETENVNQKYYADGKISESEIESQVQNYSNMLSQLVQFSDEEVEYLEKQYVDKPGYEGMFDVCRQLKDDELGTFSSYKNITVDETDKTELKVLFDMVFANGTRTISIEFTCHNNLGLVMNMLSVTDRNAGKESVGEKLAEAGANTLMGMGTVFAVLIFMSLIISLFKFIPVIMDKLNNKDKKQPNIQNLLSENDTPAQRVDENINANDVKDAELIAVIAAAIAASEQTTTDSFVVRSIRRR